VTARILSLLLGPLLAVTAVSAQATTPSPASSPQPVSPNTKQEGQPAAAESPAYTYDPHGRRDPFVSLLRRGTETDRSRVAARVGGVSTLEASEVVLKGTMQSRTGYVALVEATDRKTYIVKAGDRLLDGTVRTITAEGMVILQHVNDPLSLEKQREIRKMLRQTDEVK
jgi:Tfp pilus assembly protein PilP